MDNNMAEEATREKSSIDLPLTIVSVAAVFVFVGFMALEPEGTLKFVNTLFDYTTRVTGTPILWFVFLGLITCLYLAFGRFGKIKLGNFKPEFSFFSYCAMMICAALASTAVFYSFVEWTYYYTEPAFGIAAKSQQAADYALAYAFFHWGPSVQVIFVLTAVPMAYAVYVKKLPVLRVSAVCEHMMESFRYKKQFGKLIDLLTIFSIVGGLGVSLGLGVPLIAAGIGHMFNFEPGFGLSVGIVVVLASVFSISSFIGIEKGMRNLSDYTIYVAIAFIAYIFVTGPAEFIVKYFTNTMAELLDNYVKMSLWTDPIGKSGFPEANTIFLFTLGLNYAAMMGVFITKISKGRTIQELVVTCLFGLSLGTWLMFGINSGFGLNAELTGIYKLTEAPTGQIGVFQLLDLIPGGVVITIIFTLLAVGFLTTSLDSAAFTLSAVATKKLDKDGNTNPAFRLFWCVVLAAVPLSIMFSKAPFSALKTLCIFLSVPFLIIIVFMVVGLFRWLVKDAEHPAIFEDADAQWNMSTRRILPQDRERK